jgi:hypothetical protein
MATGSKGLDRQDAADGASFLDLSVHLASSPGPMTASHGRRILYPITFDV